MEKVSNYIKDENGQWWYVNRDKKYKAFERTCTCGKTEIVRNITKTDVCKSCALTGLEKNETHKSKIGESNKGKGKGISNNHGYILISSPNHPNKDAYGYVPEHRLVMEKMIGRYLTQEEIIHHIDGNKSNNKPSNLWVFKNRSDHTKHHEMMRASVKKSNYVYLAGNISHNPATYEWRENVEFLLREERLFHKVVIVNPCANSFNASIKNYDTKQGLEFIKEAVRRSQHLLRAKDYQLIRISNAIIVDLVIGTDEKPLIGTIQELCWAKDVFNIPVIAVTHGKETPYTTHPWIDECCSAKVETVEDAVAMLKTFFLEY